MVAFKRLASGSVGEELAPSPYGKSRFLVDWFSFVTRAHSTRSGMRQVPFEYVEGFENYTDEFGTYRRPKKGWAYESVPYVERDDRYAVEEMQRLLGLSGDNIEWREIKGRYRYAHGLTFGGINIYWGKYSADGTGTACPTVPVVLADGKEVEVEMGVCVEMSGQGCRTFETYGTGNFGALYAEMLYCNEVDKKYKPLGLDAMHITRMDIAFDDRQGLLDLPTILDDCKMGHWRGRFRGGTGYFGFGDKKKQDCAEFGSKQSLVRIRIYDKAAERGYADTDMHWTRVELQLRDDRANTFAGYLASGVPVGKLFCSTLRNYLVFCAPAEGSSDSNKRRWPVRDYWAAFLGDCEAVSIFSTPGLDYNMRRLERYVKDMSGKAVVTYLLTHRLEEFLAVMDVLSENLPPKYQTLIECYGWRGDYRSVVPRPSAM